MTYNENPEITRLFLWGTTVESFVLLAAGGGLLFFPSILEPLWPWEVTPFNALLLGSIYSASLVATAMTVHFRHWSPARIVAPMIFLFTAIVFVISLANIDRFNVGHYSTWLWFLLYIGIPANAAYYMWPERHRKPYFPYPLPDPWKQVVVLPVILLGVYGLALLIDPDGFASFWPWPIDAFHGRMYSVAYLTPALGAILLWRAAAMAEMLTLGLTLIAGGITPIIGLVIVDIKVNRVDWAAQGTWLWIGTFAILFLAGVGLTWLSRKKAVSRTPITVDVR